MTDLSGHGLGRSNHVPVDSERDRSRARKHAQCTLAHAVAALTEAAGVETSHPVVVQLEAGTPVVVMRTSSVENMVDVESCDGRKYTVFAVDLAESTDDAVRDETP